jgi:hypothetical protein
MNRQDAALVPFGQMSEVGWRFWLTVVGARSRAALATVRFERRSKWLPGNETRIVPATVVSADAAAKQCTTPARFRPTCPPTIFPAGI